MELLVAWVAALGACDVILGGQDEVRRRRWALAATFGTTAAVLILWALGMSTSQLVLSGAVVLVLLTGWIVTSRRALQSPDWVWSALAVAGIPTVGAIGLGGHLEVAPRDWLTEWYSGLDVPALQQVPVGRFVLGVAVGVYLVNTCNVLVRIVLRGANAPAPTGEQQLKGGRLLGPMERIFIFALALGGNFAAASVVAGAKSLLRFPEIRNAEDSHTDSITEYFLIGSFTSWMSALLFVPLF